jgi:hypothetical protein
MYNKIFTNSLFYKNKEHFADSNLQFPEYEIVSSGQSNDSLSLTEEECKAYAETHKDVSGYNYDTLNITNRPYGCYKSGNSFRYAENGTLSCGSGNDNCIKKKQYMNLLDNVDSNGINTEVTPLHEKWNKFYESDHTSGQVPQCNNLQNCTDLYTTNYTENNLRKYYLKNARLNWKFFNDDYKKCVLDKSTIQGNLDICNSNSGSSTSQQESNLKTCNDEKLDKTNKLTTCTTDKNNCNSDLDQCNAQKGTIVTQKDDISTQLSTRNTELNTCNQQKTTCETEKSDLVTNYTTISNEKQTCDENLNQNSTKLTECLSQKTTLTDDLTSCNTTKVEHKNNLDTCNNTLSQKNIELELCNDNLLAASGSDTDITTLLQTCNTNLSSAKASKENYLSLFNEKTNSLNEANGLINNLKNEKKTLKDQLQVANDNLTSSNTLKTQYFNKSKKCDSDKELLNNTIEDIKKDSSDEELHKIKKELETEKKKQIYLKEKITKLEDTKLEIEGKYTDYKREFVTMEKTCKNNKKNTNYLIFSLCSMMFFLLIAFALK